MNIKNWIQFLKHSHKGILVLLPLCLFAGCVNLKPVEDTTKFYVLSVKRDGYDGEIEKRVAVRSIDLVDYLRNTQIVKRARGNEIKYLAGHRWAGDLDLMIGMVVADEIEDLRSGVYATVGDSLNPDLNLDLKVLNFDITASDSSEVTLEWVIIDAVTREILHEGRGQASVSSSSSDPSDQVAALESALRQITATIVQSL
ncbi:MAG: membrane integrity-associated transporter subunit PqiC [Puniceicoccaceae bacterium]